MARNKPAPYYRATAPFLCDNEKQFVEVADTRQTVRRCRWRSKEPIEETVCPITSAGCYIHEIAVSPSGTWLVTQRISGRRQLTRWYSALVPRSAANENA